MFLIDSEVIYDATQSFCASHGIRLVLIPPVEKELQGLVERANRQDDEELLHRIKPHDLPDFNKILNQHLSWRNSKRRRKLFGWKNSDQFLKVYRKKMQQKIWGVDEEENEKTQLKNKTTEESFVLVKQAA